MFSQMPNKYSFVPAYAKLLACRFSLQQQWQTHNPHCNGSCITPPMLPAPANPFIVPMQVLLPQRLYILRSKATFLPIGVISLSESKPVLDAAGRTIHFKVVLACLSGPVWQEEE